jgi:hypothetical protein
MNNIEIDYYRKYLKYKTKYLELIDILEGGKGGKGGGKDDKTTYHKNKISRHKKKISKHQTKINGLNKILENVKDEDFGSLVQQRNQLINEQDKSKKQIEYHERQITQLQTQNEQPLPPEQQNNQSADTYMDNPLHNSNSYIPQPYTQSQYESY